MTIPGQADQEPMAENPASADAGRGARASRLGLSGKLLVLTVLFVMMAEVLIYVPSIANFRLNWLNDRLSAAYTAALAPDATVSNPIAGTVSTELFLNNLIGHTIYFVVTLASSDGLNTPTLNYYFVEPTTPWSWEMLLDCTAKRRLR